MRVSNNPADAFAFRTPSLRNVTLTAPYGHAGAYQDLTAYLRQHIAPQSELASYDISNALLPKMEVSKPDLAPEAANFSGIAKAAKPKMPALNEAEIREIVAFLQSLEDPIARAGGKMGIPPTVPSGLGVDQ